MKKEVVLGKIRQSISIAEKEKAEIVGLTGFTSIVSNQGEDFLQDTNLNITTGNTYTASLVIDSIEDICKKRKIDTSKSSIMIIGATGDIGCICSKYFCKKFGILNLAARDIVKLGSFRKQLQKISTAKIEIVDSIADAANSSDVVVAASSATTTLL